jgi:hypothetical protein
VFFQPIIDSVISGNYSLARVLPQIYTVNPDPIKNHVMTLVSILPNCENNDVTALLNLFSLIAKDSPAVSSCSTLSFIYTGEVYRGVGEQKRKRQ